MKPRFCATFVLLVICLIAGQCPYARAAAGSEAQACTETAPALAGARPAVSVEAAPAQVGPGSKDSALAAPVPAGPVSSEAVQSEQSQPVKSTPATPAVTVPSTPAQVPVQPGPGSASLPPTGSTSCPTAGSSPSSPPSSSSSSASSSSSSSVEVKSQSSKPAPGADKRAPYSDKRADGKLKSKKPIRRGNAPCLSWMGEGPVKAVLVLVHGLGLHNGTYESFGKRMSSLGYAAYAIDVRGFGSWMEAKGRENVDFEGCLSDLEKTLKVVRRANPNKPVFLLGESMGGAIALRATALYPQLVNGLISSVPAADRFKQNETSLKVAFHFLTNPDKPFNVGEGVIKQATNKPELREAWSNDPLARMNLSPKELIQFQMFMNQNHDSAREIVDKPVLIVQGVQDKLVRPQGTVELFNELTTKDKEIVLIPNAEHLIFEENQFNDEVVDKVVDWITKHMPAPVQGAN